MKSRDRNYLLLGVGAAIVSLSYVVWDHINSQPKIKEDGILSVKSNKFNYTPVLHSEGDITDELIYKIIHGEVDSLTIDYNFTRCIKDGESINDYNEMQHSKNIFMQIDKYRGLYGNLYGIRFPVKFTPKVTTLACAFKDNSHLEYINIENTSNIVDMTSMFENAKNFMWVLNMNDWDVSKVTSMSKMFKGAEAFDADISKWDTSSVTDMSEMFSGTKHFISRYIGDWNTNNVVNMSKMFYMSRFNQDISKWYTNNVLDMSGMFYGSEFNYSVNDWDTSNVRSMKEMFYNSQYDQMIADWNTQNVVDMSYMFALSEFNKPIDKWNTSKVKNFSRMFKESKFNQSIGQWDTSSAEDMSYMFIDNKVFNQPLSNWNTSKVKNFTYMFAGTSFNQPIGNWDTSSAEDMSFMFYNNKEFNQTLKHWNTSNVASMTAMFMHCSKFDQDLSNWSFASLKDNDNMFYDNYSKYKSQINNLATNAINKNKETISKDKTSNDVCDISNLEGCLKRNPLAVWREDIRKDQFTGNTNAYYSNWSTTHSAGDLGYYRSLLLQARCENNKTELYIDFGDIMTCDDSMKIGFKLDDGKPYYVYWTASTDCKGLFSEKPVSDLRKMKGKKKLMVRFTPYRSGTKDAIFDIMGIDAVVERLSSYCHWKK